MTRFKTDIGLRMLAGLVGGILLLSIPAAIAVVVGGAAGWTAAVCLVAVLGAGMARFFVREGRRAVEVDETSVVVVDPRGTRVRHAMADVAKCTIAPGAMTLHGQSVMAGAVVLEMKSGERVFLDRYAPQDELGAAVERALRAFGVRVHRGE